MRGATGLTVAGTIGAAAAPVLPWARTGRTERSGFALAGLAQRLGLAHTWPLKGLLFQISLDARSAARAIARELRSGA